MLKSRVLLVLALAQLLGYGCDVSLEAESKLFACTSDEQCLTGFICKTLTGAENEALAEVSACQRCTIKSVSVPQFQLHPACVQQSSKMTQNLDCDLLSTQTFQAAQVSASGQWTASYPLTASLGSKQLNVEPAGFIWKPGERITVSNTSSIKTADGAALRPYIWQFQAPVPDGRAEFQRDVSRDSNTSANFRNSIQGAKDAQLGDLDGDGDLDIVFASSVGAQSISIWLNESTEANITLRQSASLQSQHSEPLTQHVALGDLDGDGDLDILAIHDQAQNEVWFNDGQATFTQSTLLPKVAPTEKHTNAALGDLDGDGDTDFIITDTAGNGNSAVWLQNAGQFSATTQSLRDGLDVALGDLDSDGDLDALISTESKGVIVWINQGDGTFADINKRLDVKSIINTVALGDLDSDGDLDAVLGKSGANQIWQNDGIANFSLSDVQDIPLDDATTQEALIADFNADGHLDLFFANSDRSNSIWINDGTAHFKRSTKLLGLDNTPAASVGDLNNDKTLDLILVQPEGNEIWKNLPKSLNNNTFNIVKGDLLRNVTITPNAVIEVSFSEAAKNTPFTLTPADPAFITVHGQWGGLYDVQTVCANPDNCTTVLIQPPSSGYQAGETLTLTATSKITSADETKPLNAWTWQLTVASQTASVSVDAQGQPDTNNLRLEMQQDVFRGGGPNEVFIHGALGDLDNDSDLDVVVATSQGRVLIWENQICTPGEDPPCTAPFRLALSSQVLLEDDFQSNPEARALGVALADLDNDGRLDIFVFFDGLDRIWWQNEDAATERFSQGPFLSDATEADEADFEDIGSSRTVDVIAQDFNRDGLIDLYVANQKQSNTLWLNQGNRTFSNTKQNFGSDGTFSAAAADLDDNGALDIYVANDASDNVWYNDRDATFISCNEALSSTITTKVAIGNFSQDDDPTPQQGSADIYLAQTATDSFFTADPNTGQLREEKILNNTGTIETPDAVLVDLFHITPPSPSEANQAPELVSINENRFDVLKFKFASPDKIVGEYIYQKIYFLESDYFLCVNKIIHGDLDKDNKMDFLLFPKENGPGCDYNAVIFNKSQ